MSAVSKTERKVTKIGNSLGITFPNEMLKRLNVSQGDEVIIEQADDEIIIRKNVKISLPKGISKDFFDVFNETLAEYDETIKGLRDR